MNLLTKRVLSSVHTADLVSMLEDKELDQSKMPEGLGLTKKQILEELMIRLKVSPFAKPEALLEAIKPYREMKLMIGNKSLKI